MRYIEPAQNRAYRYQRHGSPCRDFYQTVCAFNIGPEQPSLGPMGRGISRQILVVIGNCHRRTHNKIQRQFAARSMKFGLPISMAFHHKPEKQFREVNPYSSST
jgi:hypothetical protein